MDSDGADVHAGLTKMNAAASEIRAILLTHWHNDHAAGAHALHVMSHSIQGLPEQWVCVAG
jgi:glyoxylase-like metal-dependent hydrolase (beta-lactamase superfamily II)